MADRRDVVDRCRAHTERHLEAALEPFDDSGVYVTSTSPSGERSGPRRSTVLDPLVVDPPPYFDDSFPESVDAQFDRWAGVGGANVFDVREDEPKMLAVKPGYKDTWSGTGGDLEVGESLAETARREVREETNYDVELTGVFYAREMQIDYGPPEPVPIPMVIYTARPVDGRLAVPAHKVPTGEPEIEDARWFSRDELPENMVDRERIRAYLEELA